MLFDPPPQHAENEALRAGEALMREPGDMPQGVIGGIFHSRASGRLCVISSAHVFAKAGAGWASITQRGLRLEALPLHSTGADIGPYRSASSALALAPIPDDVTVDVHDAAGRITRTCPPSSLLGLVLTGLARVTGRAAGEVVAVGTTITLRQRRGASVALHGLLEIRAFETDAFFGQQASGAPLYAPDGSLAAFLLASEDGVAFAVPAVNAFEELALQFATPGELSAHNEQAERTRSLAGSATAANPPQLAVIYRFARHIKETPLQYLRAIGR